MITMFWGNGKNSQGRFVQPWIHCLTDIHLKQVTETESDSQIGMLSLNNTCKDCNGIISSPKTMAFPANDTVTMKKNIEGYNYWEYPTALVAKFSIE